MYLNTQGFYVDADFQVNGTLNVAYGDIRVGEDATGKIIVNSGATLNILDGVEFKDSWDDADFKKFVQGAVTLNGGTFVYGNNTVTIDGENVTLTPITN